MHLIFVNLRVQLGCLEEKPNRWRPLAVCALIALCRLRVPNQFAVPLNGNGALLAHADAAVATLSDCVTGFAQLIKIYRATQEGEARYSPEVADVEVVPLMGQDLPNPLSAFWQWTYEARAV